MKKFKIHLKHRNILPLVLCGVLLAGSLSFFAKSHATPGAPSLYLNPANQTVNPSTSFTVTIHENSGLTSVNAVQSNLSYPTANMTLNSIDYSTSAFSMQVQSVGASGTINIARAQVGGVSGDQIIAVLHFTSTAVTGTSSISFTGGTGLASTAENTNILPALSSTAGDSVNVPQVRLSASPTLLASGQSTTLTWNSNNMTSCSATSPSGWTSSTGTSGTQSVSPTSSTTYSINCTGSGGSSSASATVAVYSNTSYSLWPNSAIPGTIDSNDGSGVEVGTKFQSSASGAVTGIKFYKGNISNGGTHVGNLWDTNGNKLATVTFSGETNSGWQTANFPSPVSISANTTYIISYWAPDGRYSVNNNYFNSARTNGPLTAPADSASSNGVYVYGSDSFPTSTSSASNYWVDLLFSPLTSGSVTGDLNSDGQVNVYDLSILLSHWQQAGAGVTGDLNNDNIVNVFDLSILLSHYGS